MFVGKTKINEKERGDGPFKATIIACTMPIFQKHISNLPSIWASKQCTV